MSLIFPNDTLAKSVLVALDKFIIADSEDGDELKDLTYAALRTNLAFVDGPASAVNNNIAAFDTTTGKLIKDSGYKLDDAGINATSLWSAFQIIAQLALKVTGNNSQLPTQAENDALVGAGGTVGSANVYETQYDTSNASTKTATTISFTASTKTIADSGNGFVTAGFKIGTQIVITGSASNNGTFTIASVAAGAIVVLETLVNESAGATVVMTTVTADKLVRYTSTSQVKVATTPVDSNDATSKSWVQSLLGTAPMYEQTIGIFTSTLTSVPQRWRVTSETDGSVIYVATQSAVSDTLTIRRYAKNSTTGKYLYTHSAAFTSVGTSNWSRWSLAVVGDYLYVVGVASSTQAKRFAKADLTGATTLTVSGTVWGDGDACTTDGTDLLVYDSANNFRRFTISGTTITNAGNVEFTGSGYVNNGSAIYDGTYIHMTQSSISNMKKYNTTGGAAVSTNSANIQETGNPNQSTERLFIFASGVLGYSLPYTVHNDTAMVGMLVKFCPFIATTY